MEIQTLQCLELKILSITVSIFLHRTVYEACGYNYIILVSVEAFVLKVILSSFLVTRYSPKSVQVIDPVVVVPIQL